MMNLSKKIKELADSKAIKYGFMGTEKFSVIITDVTNEDMDNWNEAVEGYSNVSWEIDHIRQVLTVILSEK